MISTILSLIIRETVRKFNLLEVKFTGKRRFNHLNKYFDVLNKFQFYNNENEWKKNS